jgi:hypothetical protein
MGCGASRGAAGAAPRYAVPPVSVSTAPATAAAAQPTKETPARVETMRKPVGVESRVPQTPATPPAHIDDGTLPLPKPFEVMALRATFAKKFEHSRTPVLISGDEEAPESLRVLIKAFAAKLKSDEFEELREKMVLLGSCTDGEEDAAWDCTAQQLLYEHAADADGLCTPRLHGVTCACTVAPPPA